MRSAGRPRGSVQVDRDGVYLRMLIVQMKIVPLPVYLETADESATRAVMVSLGHCIRNNAATNIFNKDLDSRNYGVGRYGRVFLFDYDAVEKLTDVKIRTNADREPGEEAIPAWFFEDGVVFLPEELEYGMQFKSAFARRCFREENAELMSGGLLGGDAAEAAARRSPGTSNVSEQRQAQDGLRAAARRDRAARSLAHERELAVRARGVLVGERVARMRLADERLEIRRGQGTAEMIALVFIAAGELQEIELRRRFHPFGDHFETQAVRERDDGAHDRRVFRAG